MRVLLARLLVVVAMLALAGCTQRVGGTPDDSSSSAAASVGPVDLAVPVELRPVLAAGATAPPDAEVLADPSGERLTLLEPMLTVRRLDKGEVSFDQTNGTWVLTLDLTEQDGKDFGDWTTDNVGERLAMVVDDEVLIAPQIQSGITGGEIVISPGQDGYTQDEARDLLDKITGK